MTKSEQGKLAKHILRLLKVDEIIFPICRTSKGNFGLRYGVNTDDYEMYLDAVPLPTKDILNDENNIELKKMLEKYLFEDTNIITGSSYSLTYSSSTTPEVALVQPVKKRGRPAGSKNVKKSNKETA